MEDTAFIRLQDMKENAQISGVFTIPFYDLSKTNYRGLMPNGNYNVSKNDIQKIAEILTAILEK